MFLETDIAYRPWIWRSAIANPSFLNRILFVSEKIFIGDKIHALRLNLNYTQKEVEKGTGIPQSNLSEFENGKLNPSIQTLLRLAKFMKASVSYFLSEDDIEGIKSSIRASNEFSDNGKKEIMDFIDFIHKKEQDKNPEKQKR